MIQRPSVVGLFVCQQVIIAEGTRMPSFINVFSKMVLRNVEEFSHPFSVCAIPTDGMGEVTLAVRIAALHRLDAIYERQARANFTNPLKRIRLLQTIRLGALPGPGAYQVSLFANEELLAQSVIDVLIVEE